jgi:hypothetical protein
VADWLVGLADWLLGWLTDWLAWLTDCLAGWLIAWLADCLGLSPWPLHSGPCWLDAVWFRATLPFSWKPRCWTKPITSVVHPHPSSSHWSIFSWKTTTVAASQIASHSLYPGQKLYTIRNSVPFETLCREDMVTSD